MSRVGLKIGLVITLLLVITVASASAQTCIIEGTSVDKVITSTVAPSVTMKLYDIDKLFNCTTYYLAQYDYGETIKILLSGLDADNTTTFKIVDKDTHDAKYIKSFQAASKEISIDTTNLYPGEFYIVVMYTNELINTSNSITMKEFNVPLYLKLHVAKPKIEISIQNARIPIVKGDAIVAKVKIYGTALPINQSTYVYISGPISRTVYWNGTGFNTSKENIKGKFVSSREETLVIPTEPLFTKYNGTTGVYTLTVEVLSETESVDVEIKGISITFDMPTTATLGTKIKFKGYTNVAETDSTEDVGVSNMVYVGIWLPNGSFVMYNGALRTGVDEVDTSNYTRVCKVDADGSWENDTKVLLDPRWGTGSYKIQARAVVTNVISDTETIYISVEEPTIEFTMDKSTFARGEDIKFKGIATVEKGTVIQLECDKGWSALLREPIAGKYIEVSVGADGKWETKKYHIKPDATKTTYTITARIKGTTYEDVFSLKVEKAPLTAEISRTSAPRGGDVTISGETTMDYVFIYTDDWPVLKNVGEIPSDTSPFYPDKYTGKKGYYKLKVVDNKFSVQLTVNESADTGTYIVYVIAPANESRINPTEDAMVQLSLTVTEFGFLKVPSEIRIARGDTYDVYVQVNADPDDVRVKAEFTGHGVDVKEENFVFTKYNESNETGWVYGTIYPFYDDDNNTLSPDTGTLLRAGTYSLTLHLYRLYDGKEEEISEAKTTIPVIVEPLELSVTVPDTVTKGEKLVVKIDTNRRSTKIYDYIYVVLDLGVKKMKYTRIALDSNGSAEVEIPTAGIDPGTYKLYVRDAMVTLDEKGRDIEEWYDIQPTDAYAKDFNADDDVLWIGEVKVVAPGVVTPTPTTPTPTTPVVTPTTPTPTTPPPTTPTPTTPVTTPPATTPPPTTTTPTPGFEAIFAVAGLLAIAYLLRRH